MIDPFVSRGEIIYIINLLPRQTPHGNRSEGESWSVLCVIMNSITFVLTLVRGTAYDLNGEYTYGYEVFMSPAVLLVH